MEKLEQLVQILETAKADGVKFFEAGNASAGTRLRKAMQEVKTLAQAIRNEVTEVKNKI